MNVAKQTALASLDSELDKIVREFRDEWPGELCGRSDVRRYASSCVGGQAVDDRHLTHAMNRAGMIATGKRVRFGMDRDRIVIVRDLTKATVEAMDPSDLMTYVLNARTSSTG